MSLNRLELDDVNDLKIIDKLVLKLSISPRVSQEYGELQLSYQSTRYFNPASQVAIQCMLSNWAHAYGGSVMQREQHEYDVKRNIRNFSLAYPNISVGSLYMKPLVRGIFRALRNI